MHDGGMPDTNGVRYYVLTLRGERGPVDRKGMRELLQQGEIRLEDQVRNAFGRNLGTVRDVLASQPRSLPSGRQRAAPSSDEPSARRSPLVLILVAGAVVLGIVMIAAMASGGAEPVPPAPKASVGAAEPVRPTPPVPSTSQPPSTPRPKAETVVAAPPPTGDVARSAYQHGEAYASGENQAVSEGLLQALDGRAESKWLSRIGAADDQGRRAWVRLDPRPAARRIAGYALTSANDYSVRDPLSWTLVGIASSGVETTLDQRDNEQFAERFQRREFVLPAVVSFPAYRLDIKDVSGGVNTDLIQLAEITLLPAP